MTVKDVAYIPMVENVLADGGAECVRKVQIRRGSCCLSSVLLLLLVFGYLS